MSVDSRSNKQPSFSIKRFQRPIEVINAILYGPNIFPWKELFSGKVLKYGAVFHHYNKRKKGESSLWLQLLDKHRSERHVKCGSWRKPPLTIGGEEVGYQGRKKQDDQCPILRTERASSRHVRSGKSGNIAHAQYCCCNAEHDGRHGKSQHQNGRAFWMRMPDLIVAAPVLKSYDCVESVSTKKWNDKRQYSPWRQLIQNGKRVDGRFIFSESIWCNARRRQGHVKMGIMELNFFRYAIGKCGQKSCLIWL